jgi:ribonuclease E
MTFYEAALRVLEAEGRPLHVLEITEKSISQSLLSHIGKTPEQTMLSRLAAMARRTRDRRVMVTAKDTFALIDWALPEDAEALAQTGAFEEHPDEGQPPLRPAERHPEPRSDNVRAIGRTERKRRREEEEDKGVKRRKFPPLPEVVFELLSEGESALTGPELLEAARGKELAGEISTEQLLTALLEDNQRRIDAGRRPQFLFEKSTGKVSLERAGAPSEAPPLELQAAFAEALGIPLEGGRPVLRTLQPLPEAGLEAGLVLAAKNAAKEARRGFAKSLRRKLAELDGGTFEKSVVKVLHALSFRELKVAKRGKEGPLLTARKREGSVELRYAVRMLKGNAQLDRRTIQELRRDLGHYSAQVGLVVSPGELRGDGKTEATANGALVMAWCGDALAEKFLESHVAVSVTQVELFEIDERFFEQARIDAEEASRRREERHREKHKDRDDEDEPREEQAVEARPEPRAERAPQAEPAPAAAAAPLEGQPPLEASEEGDDEGDEGEEGDEALEAASAFVSGQEPGGQPGQPGQPGERRRRRRRRRGRRGRGRGPEGAAPGAPGAPPAEGAAAAAQSAPASAAPPQPSEAGPSAEPVTPPPRTEGSSEGA